MAIYSFAPRVVAASLLAYIASQFLNNFVFAKLKERTGDRKFWQRAMISSVPAHMVDTLVFETVAFLGVLPFADFCGQAVFAFIAGMTLELVLSPITVLCRNLLKGYISKEAGTTPVAN